MFRETQKELVVDLWAKRCLLIGSLMTMALLALAAYEENLGADWTRHQKAYKDVLLGRAKSEAEREAAGRFGIRQRQLFVPDLGLVDRCVTCHIAVDDPEMGDAPQPLAAHPGDLLLQHPKEEFGCVICHKGQGLATTAEDAHGHVAHWPEPMLPGDRLDEACARCHTQPSLPGVPAYNRAMGIFHEKSCLFCHTLRGEGGDVGPDISRAGELHDAEWHFEHFKDPKSVVATSEMPNLELSDEEADALTFLMMCLAGDPIPTHLLSNPKPDALETTAAIEVDPLALKGFVGSQTCMGCHRNLHPETVAAWKGSRMASAFARIEDEPVLDNCLSCHATGYNPETGHYSEEGVGCEACHGAGREPVQLVLKGRVDEHKKALRIRADSPIVCIRCHDPHVSTGTHADRFRLLPPRFPPPEDR